MGGLGSLLSGNKAEREAKRQREAQAAAEAAAKAQAIAAQHRDLEIQLMEASGNTLGALAARRADELAAMEASNRGLAEQIYALEDQRTAAEAAARATEDAARAAEDLAQQLATTIRTFADEVQAAAARVDSARLDLAAAYSREQSAINATKSKAQSLADSLGSFLTGLSASNDNSGGYGAARSALLGASNDNIQSAAETFLTAAKSNATDALSYRRDVALVQRTVAAAQAAALTEVSIADQQLSALEASVSGLGIVNMSVMSVREAVVALQNAMSQQEAAQTVLEQKPGFEDWASYGVHYKDVAAEWDRLSKDPALRQWWSSAEDFYKWHYDTSGKTEGRTPYATGGAFMPGGQIVSSPTSFHNSQMAEAGPEAIMPLAWGPGGLGVRIHGGSNDNGSSNQELAALRAQVAALQAQAGRNDAQIIRLLAKIESVLTLVTLGGEAIQVQEVAA